MRWRFTQRCRDKTLAKEMANALNIREKAITKAEKELATTALPRKHNPAHAETALKIERVLRGLGAHMTGEAPSDEYAQGPPVRSFIVHDHQSLYELIYYLQNTLGLDKPTVLQNMPSGGKTLIEKFESAAETTELGFFLGKLGRTSGKILLLHKGPVEIPSDIAGIEYIDITNGIESAGEKIRRELRVLGILK
jgi:predicted nucleotide-binding protein